MQLTGHLSLPMQPWSLGTMGHQESISQAALTTRRYLWATGSQNPQEVKTPLGQGQSQSKEGDGWPWQSHKHYTEGASLWHWKEDTRCKEGMNRATASTISPLTPRRYALCDTEEQLAPWQNLCTWTTSSSQAHRQRGLMVDGVPLVFLHCHLNQLLGLTLAQWLL